MIGPIESDEVMSFSRPCAPLANAFLSYIKCFPNTEVLDLSLTREYEEHLGVLSSLRHLREITLPYKISAGLSVNYSQLAI